MRDLQRRADAGGRGGHHAAVAVRPVAAVRLRRGVHVRGRLPASPSGARPRCPSTRGCWPSCSAGRSCASCSTPRCSPSSSAELQRLAAGPAGPRRRGGRRPAAPARAAVHRGGRRAAGARQRRRRATGCRCSPTPAASSRCGSAGAERWAVVEDVARLRDGLGVPVPPGTPDVFTEPVDDPLGDLVARFARTHGPFTTADVATRLGLGVAVAHQTLLAARPRRAGARGRVPARRARAPSGATPRCCAGCGAARWPRCARRSSRSSRRRSGGSCRRGSTSCRGSARLRGVDGVVAVVEQLAGCAVPASALEPLVLPSRVVDYAPAMLDELTATGEVLWAGHGALPGHRRLGLAAPGRHRPADAARPAGARPDAGARRGRSTRSAVAARTSSASSPTRSRSHRRHGARAGAVGPGVVRTARQRHAGPGAGAVGRRPHRRTAPAGHRLARARRHGPAPATCRRAAVRRRRPGGGRCCPSWRPTHPAGARRPPRGCSSGTASSPAAP